MVQERGYDGGQEKLSPAELNQLRAGSPEWKIRKEGEDRALRIGDRVIVAGHMYAQNPTEGRVVSLSAEGSEEPEPSVFFEGSGKTSGPLYSFEFRKEDSNLRLAQEQPKAPKSAYEVYHG